MSNPRIPFQAAFLDDDGKKTQASQDNLDAWNIKTNNLWGTHNGRQTKWKDRDSSRSGKPVSTWIWAEDQ